MRSPRKTDRDWFRELYLPDLHRRDHTAAELRQLSATDPNLTRWIRIQLLALLREFPDMVSEPRAGHCPLTGQVEVFAEEYQLTPGEALWRRVNRIRSAYRSGGLGAVLAKWSKDIGGAA